MLTTAGAKANNQILPQHPMRDAALYAAVFVRDCLAIALHIVARLATQKLNQHVVVDH
jgi:hypothetical protein